MIELAFVQVHPKTKMPVNDTAYTVWYGCHMLGIETVFYSDLAEIEKDLSPTKLVHGYISSVRKALRIMGAPDPNVPDAPSELLPYFGRRLWTTTLRDVRRLAPDHDKFFIKPLDQHKLFNGHVTSGQIRDLIQTAGYPDETQVLASSLVNFVSEHRLFVHNGMMFASRHYRGDFTKSPDYDLALEIIQAYTSAPAGYALDLGVTDKGKTLIVEINDAFALGAYGAPSLPYVQMVISRWEEMTRL